MYDQDDMDDQYLNDKIQQEESGYQAEYYDVINEMSKLCSIISFNNKSENKDKK